MHTPVSCAKIQNCRLSITHSVHYLCFTFDKHLTFSDQTSALSTSCCYSHIRKLCCVCSYLDLKSASTITISVVHSKLDYCNSLYYSLPNSTEHTFPQILPTIDTHPTNQTAVTDSGLLNGFVLFYLDTTASFVGMCTGLASPAPLKSNSCYDFPNDMSSDRDSEYAQLWHSHTLLFFETVLMHICCSHIVFANVMFAMIRC